jgi:hypothetical protein
MNKLNISPKLLFVGTVILFGAFMRLIPHWPNVTPVAAMALFGGAYLGRRYLAFMIPLMALFISDIVIGFYDYMWAIYIAFALTVVIGIAVSKRIKLSNVVVAALGSSVLFFLVTNFAAWLGSPIYPQNFIGLMESYVAGLAFFNDGNYGVSFFLNEVIGTLFYSGLFFGAYALAEKRFPVLKAA